MIKLAKAPSLTERAYESIKRNLLDCAFDPHDKLTEASLAAQLGISKSPVREALYRLETEGLVRIEPRRGAHIRQFTAAEVRDIYDLREVLEGHAVTVECVDPALLEQLHASIERTRRYLHAGEKLRHIEEDLKFHGLIASSTANSELCMVLQNIQQEPFSAAPCPTNSLRRPRRTPTRASTKPSAPVAAPKPARLCASISSLSVIAFSLPSRSSLRRSSR